MRRMTYFVMALAMVLGFTQCKKDPVEPQSGQVRITLNVENGGKATDGTRVNVNDNHVTFEEGDQILVGYDGEYVGTITHNGSMFEGTIDAEPDYYDLKPLYFYFVGNKNKTGASISVGDESYTVNISNQKAELPVLSFSASEEDFTGPGSYSASLHNQCALVKFPLENEADSIRIDGMYNEATINFANPGITKTESTGTIRLYSKTKTEKWAILLPQDPVDNASLTVEGQDLTVDVPQITAGAYVTSIPTIENPATMIDLDHLGYGNTEAQDGAIIYGDLSEHYKQLSIASGATVTLRNATINVDGWWDDDFAGITCNGDATIILEGGNVVRGFGDWSPGIQINGDNTLTIMGDGSLTVSPRNTDIPAAGIGAIGGNDCGNIVITGGNISATGGSGAAAIGACYLKSCGYITITDGVTSVEATKGDDAPLSIGKANGSESGCGTVTIGGTVYWDGSDYQNDGYKYLSQSPLIYPSSTPTPDPTPTPPTEGVGSLIYDNDNYPIAMVAYVGEDYTLAIRLYDWTMYDPESEPITNFSWDAAKSMIQSYNDFTGEAWRLPTVEEWTKIFVACGCSFDGSEWNCDELMTKLNVAGGEPLYKDLDDDYDYIHFYYWTGTEGGYSSSAKAVDFHKRDGHKIASFVNQDTWNEFLVRPVIQLEAQHQ